MRGSPLWVWTWYIYDVWSNWFQLVSNRVPEPEIGVCTSTDFVWYKYVDWRFDFIRGRDYDSKMSWIIHHCYFCLFFFLFFGCHRTPLRMLFWKSIPCTSTFHSSNSLVANFSGFWNSLAMTLDTGFTSSTGRAKIYREPSLISIWLCRNLSWTRVAYSIHRLAQGLAAVGLAQGAWWRIAFWTRAILAVESRDSTWGGQWYGTQVRIGSWSKHR